MQRIERYGVIALILLLVTIAAVSFWEDAEESRALEPDLEARRGRVARVEPAKKSTPNSSSRHTLTGSDRGIAGDLPATTGSGERNRNDGWRRGGSSNPSTERSVKLATSGFKAAPASPASDPIADPGWVGDEIGIPFQRSSLADAREAGSAPTRSIPDPEEEEVAFPGVLEETGSSAAERPRSRPREEPRKAPEDPRIREVARETNPPEASPTSRTYVVQGKDTLSQIAETQLGSSRRWPEIQELNGGIDPSKIYEGLELRLPARDSAATPTPKSAIRTAQASGRSATPPPSTTPGSSSTRYVVRKGDTLSQIAERELGSSKRWTEIASLNPKVDPNRLLEDTPLRMPSSARAVTSRSSSGSSSVAKANSAPRKNRRVR